ncbi:threonine aldolase family protein [Actibacterium ureilyticum]|uniref:threonine aldolase family protein n=1 Tax=Actibacterium ureilyticum TaxID=1590614 RepID=UPI000BAAD200|nr:beta-eliminating lyase-related protein [Actibacterium ureilyticum]
MDFASDNAAPAPPEILRAIEAANAGHARSYGADALSEQLTLRIRQIFEAPEAEVFLVTTGTAANALSLACLCPPWGTIFAHNAAHIEVDECSAPGFMTGGAKLTLLPGAHGRMDPAALADTLDAIDETDIHHVAKGPLSLTNATEYGTVYGPSDLAALTAIARDHGLRVHMDGARFANALVALECTPAELSWKAGADILCLGGTKNGLLGVEAVVIFDPALAWEFQRRRKQAGHLASKNRYLSAQMLALLQDDLWRTLARRANRAARWLSDAVARSPGASITQPTDANLVFATLPRAADARLRAAGARYAEWPAEDPATLPEDRVHVRLACSWCTTDPEIERFIEILRG